MRNKGILSSVFLALAVAVVLPACGVDEKKQAFAEYEKQVEPVLEKESDLRGEFDDKMQDALAYGGGQELVPLLENRMLPFYEEMKTRVAAIHPKGADLARVHSLLARSVDLRLELVHALMTLFEQQQGMAKRIEPYVKEIQAAQSGVENDAKKLNAAARDAPKELLSKLAGLLQQEQARWQQIEPALTGLEQGAVHADKYRQYVEQTLEPWYGHLADQIAAIETDEKGKTMLEAAKDYVSARRKVLDASLKLAKAQAEAPDSGGPSMEHLKNLQQEVVQTLATYKDEAKNYRESLK